MRFWLAVGTPENWHTAFDYNGVWGLKITQEHYWNQLTSNEDLLFFYATRPVSGVVAYGIIRTKLRQISPLWPAERAENRVIWPLRFEFDVFSCLPPRSWKTDRLGHEELRYLARAGFQSLSRELAEKFMNELPASVPAGLLISQPVGPHRPDAPPLLTPAGEAPMDPHARVQNLLLEIGSLQRFVAQREFPIETRRLDVVWRRFERSVPSFVFEVHIAGNLTEAVAKLKQAHDLWNSNIFLVGNEEHRTPALQLAAGTFHEIQDRLKFLAIAQAEELHRRKLAYRQLEAQLGIFG